MKFGELTGFKIREKQVVISFEKQTLTVTAIGPEIIRVFVPLEKENEISKAIEHQNLKRSEEPVNLKAVLQDGSVQIDTGKLRIEVQKEGLIDVYREDGTLLCRDYRGKRKPQNVISQTALEQMAKEGHDVRLEKEAYSVEVVKELPEESFFYGLGDRTGFLNKKGYSYRLWNTDDPKPHVDSFQTLYKSIPFMIHLHKQGAYGIFFDQTFASTWDFGKESSDYYFFASEKGNLDYYLIAGDSIAEITARYQFLTGTAPLPQRWTLGYQQSRWGYESEEEIREVAEKMRACRIPCDAIHFDIEYMDHYKVFTWNPDHYQNPKKLLEELADQGFKAVTIIDPGVKKEDGYDIYEEGKARDYFVKTPAGEIYTNEVWPGESVYPDFGRKEVRDWWAQNHRFLVDLGVRGIWNDMNEPASFRGEIPGDIVFFDEEQPSTHEKMHNVYGHLMSKASYEGMKELDQRRPFVITRACYAGSQKYATGWTGDNHSIWAHLQMAVPQLCNLGLSGMSFVGTDIGGFGSDTTPELITRWIQLGCFSPLFRNHSSKGWRYQEPWMFGTEVLDAYRSSVELRYRLIPYFYDLFETMQRTGLPVLRPLVLHYEQDVNVRELNDEFLVGESILVAPVVTQGSRQRMIYLPEGNWFDYHTGEVVLGGRYFLREAPLSLCPIYIKAGSILPNYPVQQYIGEKKVDTLILELYPGEGCYEHYQDDGESFDYESGVYNRYRFTQGLDGSFACEKLHEGYPEGYHALELHVHGLDGNVQVKRIAL